MRAPDHRIVLGLHRSRHECGLLTAALDLGITRIDTSFNYRDFTSHSALSRFGSGLLDRCSLSTKVGFFPRHDGTAEHSLDAARLWQALEQTNRDLRRAPDLVFLHNPERSLPGTPRDAREKLGAACAVLEDAVARGLCGAWAIASWDPAPLATVVDGALPAPSVLRSPPACWLASPHWMPRRLWPSSGSCASSPSCQQLQPLIRSRATVWSRLHETNPDSLAEQDLLDQHPSPRTGSAAHGRGGHACPTPSAARAVLGLCSRAFLTLREGPRPRSTRGQPGRLSTRPAGGADRRPWRTPRRQHCASPQVCGRHWTETRTSRTAAEPGHVSVPAVAEGATRDWGSRQGAAASLSVPQAHGAVDAADVHHEGRRLNAHQGLAVVQDGGGAGEPANTRGFGRHTSSFGSPSSRADFGVLYGLSGGSCDRRGLGSLPWVMGHSRRNGPACEDAGSRRPFPSRRTGPATARNSAPEAVGTTFRPGRLPRPPCRQCGTNRLSATGP
ncbi:aldo/keto reductase [Streptomyces nigrescens]